MKLSLIDNIYVPVKPSVGDIICHETQVFFVFKVVELKTNDWECLVFNGTKLFPFYVFLSGTHQWLV